MSEYIYTSGQSDGMNPPVSKPPEKKKISITKVKICLVVFFLLAAVLLFLCTQAITADGEYKTSETRNFCYEKYNELFSAEDERDNGILMTFVCDKEMSEYYTAAESGYNIHPEIRDMFMWDYGYTYAMDLYINEYNFGSYLDTGYAEVISYMADEIAWYGYESNFVDGTVTADPAGSVIINNTELALDEEYVNLALALFTEKTGIPCKLLIEYDYNVFMSDYETGYELGIGIAAILALLMVPVTAAVAVSELLKKFRKTNGDEPLKPRRKKKDDEPERCNLYGCDGRIDKNKKPPWEY